jgi:hypothetical protein
VRGADPVLVLYDDSNKQVDRLSIDKWTTDTVEEYLIEILKQ